jgi:hypothetical protein
MAVGAPFIHGGFGTVKETSILAGGRWTSNENVRHARELPDSVRACFRRNHGAVGRIPGRPLAVDRPT